MKEFNEITNIEEKQSRKQRSQYFIISLVLATVMLFAVSTYKYTATVGNWKQSYFQSTFASSGYSGDFMSLISSNEYGVTQAPMFAYPFLEDSLLAEPYKSTSFTIQDAVEGATYSWTITTSTSPTSSAASLYSASASTSSTVGDTVASGTFTATDSSVVFTTTLESVGWYTLAISEEVSGSVSRSFTQSVVVKYVRREIQDLTEADRNAFLDAFHTLWEVNTVDGQELYGANYKSLHFLASIHNDAGANAVCDEFHGGAGFLNNHVMLGSYLEQSLQLVDPSTCLHFMEYSKYFSDDSFQAHILDQLDEGKWTTLLTSEYFGSSDPQTGRILDGRWANESIPFMDADFYTNHAVEADSTFFPTEESAWKGPVHLSSPYGLLRSPWNYNPNPYVTRFNALNMIPSLINVPANSRSYYSGVTCKQYEKFVDKINGQPMYDYLTYAEDDVHGIIHFTFGGAGGTNANLINKQLKDDYGFTDTDLMLVQQSAQVFYKVVLALRLKPRDFATTYGLTFPLTCSDWPYDYTSYELSSTIEVGSKGGPSCTIATSYLADETTLDTLVDFYFSLYTEGQVQYDIVEKVKALDFDTKSEVMSLIVSRLAFDGEMAGSGAAQDPLFWVAHGAVEKLMHKTVFTGILSDTIYGTASDEVCSGHMANSTKSWLKGLYFQDTNVQAEMLTNIQLADILNPAGELYGELINYVYADSDFDWCEGSEDWFQ